MNKINILIISVLLFFTVTSFGQQQGGTLSPYTRLFLLAQNTDSNYNAERANFPRKFKLNRTNTEYVNCIIKLQNAGNPDDLRSLGVNINTVAGNILTAQVPVNQIEQLTTLPNIVRVEVATPVKKRLDQARTVTNVNSVHQGVDLPDAFDGTDVVVGIIDGGFEYGHINFYDTTKTVFRIKRVWDQWHGNAHPSDYNYGSEYATEESILAATTDDNSESHGTHVAGIAAGGYKGLDFWGVAPASDIVLVSYDPYDEYNTVLADGIAYIYKYAESVDKPAVVNMSLGWHLGPHDGTSLFDQMCDNMQGAGKLLVGAAGNENDSYLHISKNFTNTTDTLKTFVTYNSTNNIEYGNSDFWGSPGKDMRIKFVVYNRNTNKIRFESDFFDANITGEKTFNFSDSTTEYGVSGRMFLETEKNPENNRANALVMFDYNFSLSANCYLGVIIVAENGSTIDGWCADGYNRFNNNNESGWQNGDNNSSIGEIGGTGKRIISVGSFNTKANPVNRISSFSSLGPTADGRIKPDITAPGSYIISSLSSRAYNNSSWDNYYYHYDYYTSSVLENGNRNYFAAMEGTSMASPFVTGVLALWLQANPGLTPEDVRNIFSQTAIVDNFTGTVPNNTWGYGKIDAWAGLKNIITDINENTVDKQFMLLKNPIENAAEITFKINDDNVNIYLMDMNGKLIFSKNISQISENQTLTLYETAILPAGNYIFYYKSKDISKAIKILKK